MLINMKNMFENMTEYLDNEGKELTPGFYGYSGADEIVYFTGEYNPESKSPIFEKEFECGEKKESSFFFVKRLYKIAKSEVREKLSKLKKTTNWLEKRIEEANERTL